VVEALAAGARSLAKERQGKAYVVQSMFQQVSADVYVMVDGDGYLPTTGCAKILAPVLAGEADMVIGFALACQLKEPEFRPLNRYRQRIFLKILSSSFKVRITDLLSGYRAFSRRFVQERALVRWRLRKQRPN